MSDEKFSPSEPGASHPLTRCGWRLTDDGRFVLMAGDNAGIILDEKTGIVTVFGTEVRFAADSVKINGCKISSKALEDPDVKLSIGKQFRLIDKAKEK